MAGKKGRSGRPKGYTHSPQAREAIRTGMLISLAHRIAEGKLNGVKTDSKHLMVRMRAIDVLLKKSLPDLTATDLTSGGEPITVERVAYKRADQAKTK